jgi:hypothetical protein
MQAKKRIRDKYYTREPKYPINNTELLTEEENLFEKVAFKVRLT